MKRLLSFHLSIVFFTISLIFGNYIYAEPIDLAKAKILISNEIPSLIKETFIKVLQEEVEKRTTVNLFQVDNWSIENTTIVLCLSSTRKVIWQKCSNK